MQRARVYLFKLQTFYINYTSRIFFSWLASISLMGLSWWMGGGSCHRQHYRPPQIYTFFKILIHLFCGYMWMQAWMCTCHSAGVETLQGQPGVLFQAAHFIWEWVPLLVQGWICQTTWPVSFWEVSCLSLPSLCRSSEITNMSYCMHAKALNSHSHACQTSSSHEPLSPAQTFSAQMSFK